MSTTDLPRIVTAPPPTPIKVKPVRSTEDKIFRVGVGSMGWGAVILLVLIGIFLLPPRLAGPAPEGLKFFTTSGFQTLGAHPTFGVLASLYGTVVVAIVALVVGVPVALTTALFLSEYAPRQSRRSLIALVDLAAAIPSVIYGLWGFFELQPNVVGISNWMSAHLGFIPIFKVVSAPGECVALHRGAGGRADDRPHRRLGEPRGLLPGTPGESAKPPWRSAPAAGR